MEGYRPPAGHIKLFMALPLCDYPLHIVPYDLCGHTCSSYPPALLTPPQDQICVINPALQQQHINAVNCNIP